MAADQGSGEALNPARTQCRAQWYLSITSTILFLLSYYCLVPPSLVPVAGCFFLRESAAGLRVTLCI